MIIKKAEFVISVADGGKLPDYGATEIAVAGKSNVGKSSFINFITNNSKLARTSSEPGRTRLLNYFKLNDGEFYFVDLPGYGFAKVAKSEKAKWGDMIEGYLINSQNLKNVFVLLDIRHTPTDDDKLMINFLFAYNIPFTIIATKSDKLSRLNVNKNRAAMASALGVGVGNIYPVSALKKTGKEEILSRIEQIVSQNDNEDGE